MRIRWLFTSVLAATSLSACSTSRLAQPAPSLVIADVNVVDLRTGAVARGRTVLISGDTITEVRAGRSAGALEGAARLDGRGGYLMPGLWDMHVHVLSDPEDAVRRSLPLLISHGVTGVRDMGSTMEGVRATRARLQADPRLPAPRLHAAGPLLDSAKSPWLKDLQLVLANGADAEARLPELKAAGVDFFKVYDGLRPDAYSAVKRTADGLGMAFAGHTPSTGMSGAARVGQRTIEHLGTSTLGECVSDPAAWSGRAVQAKFGAGGWAAYYDVVAAFGQALDRARCDAAYRLMGAQGTWFTPTLVMEFNDRSNIGPDAVALTSPAGRGWCETNLRGLDAADPARREAAYAVWRGELARMRAAGVRLLAGSDTPNYCLSPGAGLIWELKLLVKEGGLSPLQALQTATVNAAEARRGEPVGGLVGAGDQADLLLLRRNPLENLDALDEIQAVVSRGRVHDRAALDAMRAAALTPSAPKPSPAQPN